MILSLRIGNFGFDMMQNREFAKLFGERLFERIGRYFVHTDAETINNIITADSAIPPRNERSYWVWFLDDAEAFTLMLNDGRLVFHVMTNKYRNESNNADEFYHSNPELAEDAVAALEKAFGLV